MTKECKDCKQVKDRCEFYAKDAMCKECRLTRDKEYRKNNKERRAEINRKWRLANKERILEASRKWSQANKEKHNEMKRNWRLANKERSLEASRKWSQANKERSLEASRNWRIKNKKYYQEYSNQRLKKRRKEDRVFAARGYMSKRLSKILKSNKTKSTISYLGCSLADFKQYIADKFTAGMSWDNYGKWHLDHIVPISSATSIEEVEKLSHYTNFQPLWAADNIRKSNKIDEDFQRKASQPK